MKDSNFFHHCTSSCKGLVTLIVLFTIIGLMIYGACSGNINFTVSSDNVPKFVVPYLGLCIMIGFVEVTGDILGIIIYGLVKIFDYVGSKR